MSSPSLELKKVEVSRSPLGRGPAGLVLMLMVFSAGVGLTQTAGLVIERVGLMSPSASYQVLTMLSPWSGEIWSTRSLFSREPADAESALQERLALSPVTSDDWVRMARLKLKRGDFAGGKAALQEAFDIAPRSPSLERARFALATILPQDVTLDVSVRRDLNWALAGAADRQALVDELTAFATPYGLEILDAVLKDLPRSH